MSRIKGNIESSLGHVESMVECSEMKQCID